MERQCIKTMQVKENPDVAKRGHGELNGEDSADALPIVKI